MKIGIMTFWESQENYGQLLQAFALQKQLLEMGHEPFLIKFHRVAPASKELKHRIKNFKLARFVKRRLQTIGLLPSKPSRGFDAFRKNHLTIGDNSYFDLKSLYANPPIADAYICGSDQVWNSSFMISCEPFLLGFGPASVKRVAYAASFGNSNLSDDIKIMFEKHLRSFHAVGVRESGGLKLCQEVLNYKDAALVADPTLLFNKEEWSKLLDIKKNDSTKGKKAFIYTLANSQINDKAKYIEFAKNLPETEVVHVTANNDVGGNLFPTIPGWITEIANANFVITNSFHGMVFCIIFNRNFVILPNTGKAVGMNDRIMSILKKLGLEEHAATDFNAEEMTHLTTKKVDWPSVNQLIKDWAVESKTFLKNALVNN